MFNLFCDERSTFSTIKKSQNIYVMKMIAKFKSLLTALIVKNILAGLYLIFLKNFPNEI